MVKRSRSGQGTVEYMLYLSVIAIALITAAYTFTGPFADGWEELAGDGGDVEQVFEQGQQSGQSNRR